MVRRVLYRATQAPAGAGLVNTVREKEKRVAGTKTFRELCTGT